MTLVSNVLGHLQQHLTKIAGLLILIALLFSTSCSKPQTVEPSTVSEIAKPTLLTPHPTIKQVDTPSLIRELNLWLDTHEPQVQLRQPQAEQIFDNTTISVVLRVQDLPIYKDKTWNMGPYVQLLLDNQPFESVYDIEKPIVLKNLTPGTHTLRAFAVRPWHESFKNVGAYAQTTFHVFAKTNENSPATNQPLLTYGAPVGTYGAEPVLLDFYLTDAPLHQVAQDNPTITDWQVRYTVNGDSLTLKDWDPIYIEGLKPGQNWVQLTLIDAEGETIQGVFNNTVRLIEYDPSLDDSLAKIVRGDVTLADVGGIIDPTYEPPIPETPEPEPATIQDMEEEAEIEKALNTKTTIPEVIEPEIAEPEVAEPKITEPDEITEPEEIESEEIESKTADKTSNSLKDTTSEQTSDESAQTELLETSDIPENIGIEAAPVEETRLENTDQPTEEVGSEPNETEALETARETESEPTAESSADKEIAPDLESTTETPEDTASKPANTDEVAPSKRRYFQRLYDYRERSMQTYGRDR